MPLEAINTGFHYPDCPWVIRGFNISIKPGGILGLFGPSGSGKSTIARILAGYENPQEGQVLLDGNRLPKKGFVPVQLVLQHPEKAINPKWQLGQTISEGWLPDPEMLEEFSISRQWLKRWPNELSSGELQRFCVIRALAPDTRYLIADEMTTMLDAITQAQIWQALLSIASKRNIGLIVVSHELSLLKRFCHKIINLDDPDKEQTGGRFSLSPV
jgi:peptide/nickel transport system ATP-binding protein